MEINQGGRKVFKVGDKVNIIMGNYEGYVGVIVQCGSSTCKIELDNTSIATYYNYIKLAFTMDNLKDGMVCTLNGGYIMLVFKDGLIGNDTRWPLCDYNQDNLNHKFWSCLDIMKINYGTEIVYERNEILKVTMKQVADAFGVDEIEVDYEGTNNNFN